MQQDLTPKAKHLIFVGGGHAHALALLMMAMKKPEGVKITLISNAIQTPYSGMLPGLIAGHYSFDEAHIDLGRLCRFAGVNFIEDYVTGIDPDNRTVHCRNHPDFSYDILSIDTGSVPGRHQIPGATEWTIPVKPVDRFLDHWQAIQTHIRQSPEASLRIGAVGGGASAVEVILAMQHKLQQAQLADQVSFHVVSGPDDILPNHNDKVRNRYRQVLNKRQVEVHTGFTVSRVSEHCLHTADERTLELDYIIWATAATGAEWPAQAGLQTGPSGCIEVNDCLQSLSHPNIFACGDIADMINHPRPKAGVFAVRQGKPLLKNLLAALAGKKLTPFKPQKQFLSLISTGDKYAVASRSNWSLAGRLIWHWKNRIDQKFMRRFSEATMLPDASSNKPVKVENPDMRCGGCGAKVGNTVLQRVLSQLPSGSKDDIPVGLQHPDDAAVIAVPEDKLLVQSVDSFRQLINDDYQFGKIAAVHALGDVFAMGATAHSAQALVTLPHASDELLEEQLLHLLKGALDIFTECGVTLVGGHTSEGSELSLGFAINGFADPQQLMTKGGIRSGDYLLVTKPLGTGVLFASDMRGQAHGRWISAALQQMQHSNFRASQILGDFDCKACTDITGFGLAGHLLEMLSPGGFSAELISNRLPVLEGAELCLQSGLQSSLHPDNRRYDSQVTADKDIPAGRQELLYDPQTAGGLLAAIHPDKLDDCLAALQTAGYSHTAVIGKVTDPVGCSAKIRLVTGTE
ncbi:selenide, water dikinase SelD [Aliamphritea hakodatensis]|uniref:selenide, water dikinase SelD n=1 Tax=Aliamphritea hakodatensis TaxID=2895352 RepID=UPI0022FD8987|nr:selenide, water dikinase SelD [Aliamphritea hakodatensis]